MESTDTFETILWLIAGVICIAMVFVLAVGWMKGNRWQKEIKMRKQQAERYM